MSMLQQILDQMFVEPEILDALDEEQKQMLFIKMREEQVKRWNASEESAEKQQASNSKNDHGSHGISWLKGTDGEVWVWVMGEHNDDLSLEELIDKRDLEEARKLAENEMLESIRLNEIENGSQPCPYPTEDETTLKMQLSRMAMHTNSCLPDSKPALQELKTKPAATCESGSLMQTSGETVSVPRGGSNGTKSSPLVIERTGGSDSGSTNPAGSTNSANSHPPVRPPRVKHALRKEKASLLSNNNDSSALRISSEVRGEEPMPKPVDNCSGVLMGANTPLNDVQRTHIAQDSTQASAGSIVTTLNKTFPFPLAPMPSVSHSTWQQRSATLPANNEYASIVKMRTNTRPSLTDEDITKRQSEIFEMMKEKHKKNVKEAEVEAERVKFTWEEQERKSREAEAQIRQIAQKAREQHRQQSLRTSTSILPALKDTKASSFREAIRNLPRPPKPKSRQAIVDWFQVEELSRGTGLDPKTRMPAPWFHGIISREQADTLLKGRPVGSFLVRVSERIWGYTVSYVVGEGSPKHFLVERIPQGYQFLGTNQVVHEQLYDLITYHETAPITAKGNEILKWPVGQSRLAPPDYADLILDAIHLPGSTHANTLPASLYRRF